MREFFELSWRVAMRHWAIYKEDFFSNILPSIVDPALYLVVLGVWLGSQVADTQGMPYVRYMAPGIAATTVLFSSFFEGSYGFYVRLTYENIFKALMTTPIGPNEIIFGEYLWGAIKGAIMATIVAIVLWIFGVAEPRYIWLMPVVGILLGFSCGALGLIATGYVKNINQFQTIYALLISPMFFVSGVFFPVDQMSRWLQWLCYVSPFFHGVRLSQATLWAMDTGSAWLIHGTVLIIQSALLMVWSWKKIYPKLYS